MSQNDLVRLFRQAFHYCENFAQTVPNIGSAVTLVKLLVIIAGQTDDESLGTKIGILLYCSLIKEKYRLLKILSWSNWLFLVLKTCFREIQKYITSQYQLVQGCDNSKLPLYSFWNLLWIIFEFSLIVSWLGFSYVHAVCTIFHLFWRKKLKTKQKNKIKNKTKKLPRDDVADWSHQLVAN